METLTYLWFQPTPPRRGRPAGRQTAGCRRRFNPRPHEGGDLRRRFNTTNALLFQPTPPRRGRRLLISMTTRPPLFQPTPPRRGRLHWLRRTIRCCGRFNPRPHEGGDGRGRPLVG